MKVVFTGSYLLEIHKGEADLSRRAIVYHLHGLSLREFLELEYGYVTEAASLSEIISYTIYHTRGGPSVHRKNRLLLHRQN